jgi:hypothetical protein
MRGSEGVRMSVCISSVYISSPAPARIQIHLTPRVVVAKAVGPTTGSPFTAAAVIAHPLIFEFWVLAIYLEGRS